MRVRLKKKLASVMDGVDVSHVRAGDIVHLADADGEVLISEGWAERVADVSRDTPSKSPAPAVTMSHRPHKSGHDK